ncbi:hypothetical protein Tco_0708012 [Tanacetum coccineum]
MKRRLFKGRVETSTDKILGEDASKQGRNNDKIEELNLTDGADTGVIMEDKGSGEKGGSTPDQVSTVRPEVSDASVPMNVSAATLSTPPTTRTIFSDEDITIARTLVKMRKLAQRLHEEELAELDRAQKERQKQEEATRAALAEEFDEIQAKIDDDQELVVRLTHEEQEKYTIKERARLLAEFFKRRKKQLAAERAIARERVENKPPTRTQVRNMMITYLKHMGKYTHQQLKHKNFEEKLEEDNDAEKEELRDSMDVVPMNDVSIDIESLTAKYPIVDWKTYILNENMMYYQIIRADRGSMNYNIFSEILNDFDRQDVIDLHRVYILLMNTGVTIHMMIEKKYPLTQEMLSRMLNQRLEVDYESEMAFELLRFTRSQLQK